MMVTGSEEDRAEVRARRALREALGETEKCESLDELARFAAGDLEAGREMRIRTHAADCARCRAEIGLAGSFFRGGAPGADRKSDVDSIVGSLEAPDALWRGAERPTAEARGGRPSPIAWRLAAAIAILIGGTVLFRAVSHDVLPPPELAAVVRGMTVDALAPEGRIPETPSELRWVAAAEAATYRVEISRVDGVAVWSASADDARIRIPEEIRANLRDRARYYWTVSALDSEERVVATSPDVGFIVEAKSDR